MSNIWVFFCFQTSQKGWSTSQKHVRNVLNHMWTFFAKGWFSHCLGLDLNGLLTRHNFWRIPGMLENHTIPKWKEFLKSHEPILRKSYLSTFIHINRHMDGARDIFWIKSVNGTFLALQIKAFGPKKIWFSCMGKKVPFWQFLKILKNCQNGTFLPMHENQESWKHGEDQSSCPCTFRRPCISFQK